MTPFEMPRPVWGPDESSGGPNGRMTDVDLLVLAREIIDRLSRISQLSPAVPYSHEVEGFCLALLEPGSEEAKLILLRAHADGSTHQEICVDYIGAAARLLGKWWDHDIVTFREMAIAAGRLLNFLRDLRDILPEVEHRSGHELLVATVPNDQHVIGATIATDVLRRKGWNVDLQIYRSEDEICRMAAKGAFPIVALSASGTDRIPELARTVVGLRIAVPRTLIFVSGHIVEMEPDICTRIGADASSVEIEDGVEALERLVDSLRVVVPLRR